MFKIFFKIGLNALRMFAMRSSFFCCFPRTSLVPVPSLVVLPSVVLLVLPLLVLAPSLLPLAAPRLLVAM